MSCDCCGKDITGNFININGGALLKSPTIPDFSSSDQLQEFLAINLHDDSLDVYDSAVLASGDSGFGQFEWYFCSKKCVRQFFNEWLDKIPDVGEGSGD